MLRLFTISETRVFVHWTWILVFVYTSVCLSFYYLNIVTDLSLLWAGFTGGATVILIFGLVILHEFGHAFVARRSGIPVKKIVIFCCGAVAVPDKDFIRPGQEAKIAAAGPAVSLVIQIVLLIMMRICSGLVLQGQFIYEVMRVIFVVNLVILFINLLPILPLDGGRLARALFWRLSGNRLRCTAFMPIVSLAAASLFLWVYYMYFDQFLWVFAVVTCFCIWANIVEYTEIKRSETEQ